MNRLALLILNLAALLLSGCGAYAPPAPTRSAIETRQTERALAGVTPLPSIAPSGPPTPFPTPNAEATAAAAQDLNAFLAIPADDPRAIGDPNAPVTIIEFSDFE